MAYYNRLQDNYEAAMQSIERRHVVLVDQARSRQPNNLDELLILAEENDDNDITVDQELNWVRVIHPLNPKRQLNVRPILTFSKGSDKDVREKDRYDQGIWMISLEATLPNEEKRLLGHISYYHKDGELKHKPSIYVSDMKPDEDAIVSQVAENSADAELFLTLVESAMAQQH